MKRFRSSRFALLLILMLTLSMALWGAATVAFAEELDEGVDVQTLIHQVHYHGNSADTGTPPSDDWFGWFDRVTAKGNSGNLEREGYTFAGWNTNAAGTGTDYAVGAVLRNSMQIPFSDINLFAKWAPIDYTVTYNGNGNDVGTAPVDSNMYNVGDNAAILGAADLVKTGYSFDGWNTAADGSGSAYYEGNSMVMGTANVVLYAQWEEDASITIHKTVGEGYEGSKFVCFSLYMVKPDAIDGAVTNGDGSFRSACAKIVDGTADIVFDNLPFGEYQLKETQMPRFYKSDLDESLTYVLGLDNLNQELTVANTYVSPIMIEKTVVPAIANIGDEVTYIFNVKNISDYNLFHVKIHDLDIPFDAYQEPGDDPSTLSYEGEFLEPDEIWTVTTTHVLTAEDMVGGSFTNVAKAMAYTCEKLIVEIPDITPSAMTAADIDVACRRLCIWVEDADDATVTLPGVVPPTVVEETIRPFSADRADPAGSFIPPEVVPLGAPVIISAPPVEQPVIMEEVIPLGVPVLPKTAELPVELFYGLGGMLTALGAYLKRR